MSSNAMRYLCLTSTCFGSQLRNQTTDGGFGAWAAWQPCSNDDGDGTSSCLCRSRTCDNPHPRCGGRICDGATIEVSNCSRYHPIPSLGRERRRGFGLAF